jgi:16S rRNA (guanine527-N7)-methyltransferase
MHLRIRGRRVRSSHRYPPRLSSPFHVKHLDGDQPRHRGAAVDGPGAGALSRENGAPASAPRAGRAEEASAEVGADEAGNPESAIVEAEPAAAAQLFGETIERARQFTHDLATHGETLGLIGPLELPRLWSRHILNSALAASLVAPGARVADVGSGAGLPGLVLAIARPDAHFVLIEPMERRTEWLRDETARLGLDNVTVLRARAEEAVSSGPFDQVTARAVSALRNLIPLCAPLVRPGGEMFFLKGARVQEEADAASRQISRFRLSNVRISELGTGVVPEATRVFRATVDAPL